MNRKEASRKYYLAHKEEIIQNTKAYKEANPEKVSASNKKNCADKKRVREELRAYSIQYLGGKCQHCGLEFNSKNSPVFDFHHRKGTDKKFCITQALRYSNDDLIPELNKCDLLCANCHRLETWRDDNE